MSEQSFEAQATPRARNAFRIQEVAARNGLSTRTIWKQISSGNLAVRKVGRVTVVLADDERRWIENLPRK